MTPGELISRAASRLLAFDVIFRGVQRALAKSLDARRALDRNIERLLAGANLPSARDVERVATQVRDLDQEIGNLTVRLEALSKELRRSEDSSTHDR